MVIFKYLDKVLKFLTVLSLTGMIVLVFGNVVLRYFFNTGITFSEEMSRFLFVWMIFLGAIRAFNNNEHISVDMFVKKLSPPLKKILFVFTNLLILYILWLVFEGTWKLVVINQNTAAPVTGISMSYVYSIGLITSVFMALIIFNNLYRLFFKKETIETITSNKTEIDETLEVYHEDKPSIAEGGR